jgi:hypothetical protein
MISFKINNDVKIPNRDVWDIEITPPNESIYSAIVCIPFWYYPNYLELLISKTNINFNGIDISFYENMDWQTLESLPKSLNAHSGQLVIEDIPGRWCVIDEKYFLNMILEFAEANLDQYYKNCNMNDEWKKRMDNLLIQLKKKRDNY